MVKKTNKLNKGLTYPFQRYYLHCNKLDQYQDLFYSWCKTMECLNSLTKLYSLNFMQQWYYWMLLLMKNYMSFRNRNFNQRSKECKRLKNHFVHCMKSLLDISINNSKTTKQDLGQLLKVMFYLHLILGFNSLKLIVCLHQFKLPKLFV